VNSYGKEKSQKDCEKDCEKERGRTLVNFNYFSFLFLTGNF
jgi:hypothetical protein